MREEIIAADNEKDFLSSRTLSNKINQRSELAQEIISNKPDFLEKWSLYIFLGILLLMLALTWVIKYPDVIEVNAVLTSKNAPKELISGQEGRLVKLFVHNNDEINRNGMIGWIESTANHQEVIELSEQIDQSISLFNLNQTDKASKVFTKKFANLGEMQLNYQQFMTAWQQFNDYKSDGYYLKKKNTLISDLHSLNEIQETIQNQKKLSEEDIKLSKESYNMYKKLLERDVLTKEEFRLQSSKYVNKQLAIPQLNNSLLLNETQKRVKLADIQQLDHDIAQEQINFLQTLQSLKSQVDAWLKRYVIRSPVKGKVYFIIPVQENQYIQVNKLIGYINPKESDFYAEANLTQYNFGKIDTGLSVQLRFNAYPYEEVGFVEGKLNYISSVPSDSGFRTTIKLINGLKTNNNNYIPYKNGLKSQAIIITKNMRLLERLYYNIVKSLSVGNKNKS